MSVTILLADDHPLIRRGLRQLLEAERGLLVVGEAEDGLQVIQMAEKLRPNVIVVDLMMPNVNGLEVMRTLRRRLPGTRMIVLSMQRADPYIVEAFRAGATAYVLKDEAPSETVRAIEQALQGKKYLSPKLPERLLDAAEMPEKASLDPYEKLTERERVVFQLVAEGKTSPEIAGVLFISPRTVEVHRGRVMEKLGVRSKAELVRFALRKGLVPLDN